MNRSIYNYRSPKPSKRRVNKKIIFSVLAVAVIIGLLVWLFFSKQDMPEVKEATTAPQNTVQAPPANSQPKLPDLQSVVDDFVANNSGTYAIKITDEQGNNLAVVNGDKPFFTASIYKLYVAYVGYQKIDDGTFSLDDPYLSGYTRGKCLDAMIRDSYSPCAEKMWPELGKEKLTTQLEGYGLTNTSLTGLTTSANDASIILRKIATGEGLSDASKNAYLDSMKTQDTKYRRGLPAGFNKAIVYNKVGWNLDQEWHDTAIVQLTNGQNVIVSVLTTGAGYQNVAKLGTAIEKALQ